MSWGDEDVVADFDTDGVTDAGERAALRAVRGWIYGKDVLDVGVGGGRTTGMLLPRAATYVGVDLAPEMLALAHERFPDADLREGDAAGLDGLSDAAYDLVVFSYNGLDALDHDRRRAALRAMARVVRPSGRVLFSSLNLDGVSFDEHPLRLPGGPRSPRFRYHLVQYLRAPRLAGAVGAPPPADPARGRGRRRLGHPAAARARVPVRRALRHARRDGGRARGPPGSTCSRRTPTTAGCSTSTRSAPTPTTCTSSARARQRVTHRSHARLAFEHCTSMCER